MYIPLFFTLIRIPLAATLYYTQPVFHVPICIAAIISDILDGWTARKWNQTSAVGGALDPLCDKIFAWGILSLLFKDGTLSLFSACGLLLRDLLLFLYALLYLMKGKSFSNIPWGSLFWGKIITTIQMYSIIHLLLGFPLHETYHFTVLGIASTAFAIELHKIAFPPSEKKPYGQAELIK